MKIGAAVVDITPPIGIEMDGYEARVGGAVGVLDPLRARVIVAEGPDGVAVALIVADLLQIDPRLQEMIATGVLAATGIPRERLQLAGTHTHSGPAFREPSEVETSTAGLIARRSVGRGTSDATRQLLSGSDVSRGSPRIAARTVDRSTIG